jgi:hypothetical protein
MVLNRPDDTPKPDSLATKHTSGAVEPDERVAATGIVREAAGW